MSGLRLGLGLGLTARASGPAVFTPASLPQLVAAWDSALGVTNGGANVAGAYGTSNALSVPSGGTAPTIDATGIEGYQALLMPGGALKTLKTATDITLTGDMSLYLGGRADHTSSTKTIFGRDTNNQEAIRAAVSDGTTNATENFRICATTGYSIALGRPIVPGSHVRRASRVGGQLTAWLDRDQIGTQAGHTGNSVWSALGYNAAGANTWQGPIRVVLVFDESVTPLTAQNHADIYAWMETRCRSIFNMDGTSGNDASDGSTPARARKTLSALNTLPFREGQKFKLANTFEADAIYFDTTTTTALTSASGPWTIAGDPLDLPLIQQRLIAPGPWTDMGGGVFKTTIALTLESTDSEYVMAGRVTNGATVTRIYTGISTTPALNHQFYDGTDLYLNVGADPTSMTVEVASRGTMATTYTNAAIRGVRPNLVIEDIEIDLFPGNGFRGGHASGPIIVRRVIARNVALDAFNVSAGTVTFVDCEAHKPGRRYDGQGSSADGFTPHGPTTMNLYRCKTFNCGKGGIAAEQPATVFAEDCEFNLDWLPIIALAQGGAGVGSMHLRRCKITRGAVAGQDAAVLVQAGIAAGYALTIEDCDFFGEGTVRGKAIDVPAQVTLTLLGTNNQAGFLSLT